MPRTDHWVTVRRVAFYTNILTCTYGVYTFACLTSLRRSAVQRVRVWYDGYSWFVRTCTRGPTVSESSWKRNNRNKNTFRYANYQQFVRANSHESSSTGFHDETRPRIRNVRFRNQIVDYPKRLNHRQNKIKSIRELHCTVNTFSVDIRTNERTTIG